ncbi:hypothetical protein [Streptomyces sp. NBC_01763]|uniref:hypothetical protein n=1 Tax=Streptomyces sp. NBC_01763 TaxID=2975934 RepID=UPI002DDADDC6|nr:hypothetical protein [Streptomyces sp. NBC_01763]WSC34652.1 hypothetical protein OHA08_03400 [Streptomyces sp. NBC_01763]
MANGDNGPREQHGGRAVLRTGSPPNCRIDFSDAARLIEPPAHARPYLEDRRDLADRVDRLVQQIERLCRHNGQRRNVSTAPEQAGPSTALRQAREVGNT